MISIGVTGATGQMGHAVLDTATGRSKATPTFAVAHDPAGDTTDGVPLVATERFADVLAEYQPDAVVDFTVPDATAAYASACAEAGVAFVTGTTGLGDDERDALDAASEQVPVLHATNFSRGIASLRSAVVAALDAVPAYDIELTETHHNRKRDAPSGTANTLLGDIEAALEDHRRMTDDTRVHGREGDQPRREGEIGVHARRAGDVRGEHEVLLAGNDEILTFTHRAESRGVFAAGALDSVVAIAEREPGRYKFADVLGTDS